MGFCPQPVVFKEVFRLFVVLVKQQLPPEELPRLEQQQEPLLNRLQLVQAIIDQLSPRIYL